MPGTGAVVVDELPLIRRGLAAIVAGTGMSEVTAVRSAREAFEILARDPDCLLVCGSAVDQDAGKIIGRLRTLRPTPATVLLLAPGAEHVAAYAVAAGVLGVGLRVGDEDETSALVTAARAGERRVSPALHADLATLRPPPLAEGGSPLLSAREREVLVLLAEGRDNRAIADALAIGPATVKSHLVRIYAKLGASDRKEAVVRAVELGVLG